MSVGECVGCVYAVVASVFSTVILAIFIFKVPFLKK